MRVGSSPTVGTKTNNVKQIKRKDKIMYYIVMKEWNYPTESGRDFICTCDTLAECEPIVKEEGEKEWNNFLDVNDDIYSEASGFCYTEEKIVTVNPNDNKKADVPEYHINSSRYEEENMWFYVRVIPIETFPFLNCFENNK